MVAEEYDAFLEAYGRMTRGTHFFVDNHFQGPSAKQRTQMADMLKDKVGSRMLAFSMVSSSPMMRGIVTAVTWIVRPPYPMTIVDDPDRGLAWLHGAYDGFSPEEVKQDIIAKVPPAAHWKTWKMGQRKAV
jgi:hypothetical protein